MWLINQDIEPQLFTLNADASSGLLLFRPPGVDGPSTNSAPAGTLMGRPVVPVEYCATLGTVGDIVLVDFSQYVMIDKQGLRQDTSMHVRFLQDEMVFRIVFRVDGQPTWNTVLTPFKGTNTVSPYVAVAARA